MANEHIAGQDIDGADPDNGTESSNKDTKESTDVKYWKLTMRMLIKFVITVFNNSDISINKNKI